MKIFTQSAMASLFILSVALALPTQVAAKRLKIKERFPSVPLKSISQVNYPGDDFRGNVVIYDVGASWAKGGDKALVYYADLLKNLKKSGLRIVVINIDEELETALEHTKAVRKIIPVLHDVDKEFVRKLDPVGFPIVYIADRKGVVRDIIRDYCENEFDLLKERILKVLNEKTI